MVAVAHGAAAASVAAGLTLEASQQLDQARSAVERQVRKTKQIAQRYSDLRSDYKRLQRKLHGDQG